MEDADLMRKPLRELRRLLPRGVREHLRRRLRRAMRPAWFGTLRRTSPISDLWGLDRGTLLDRHYIDGFIAEHAEDIVGRVIEVKGRDYTVRFGRAVDHSDVLDINPRNRLATIVSDLATCHDIAADRFDCFILTQTLQYVHDLGAAVRHTWRILRPGGVVLATLPALSRLDHPGENDFWRFTAGGAGRLFEKVFGRENVSVRSYGNVLTACASLMGMAREEMSTAELDAWDEYFPVVIAVRAVKTWPGSRDRLDGRAGYVG